MSLYRLLWIARMLSRHARRRAKPGRQPRRDPAERGPSVTRLQRQAVTVLDDRTQAAQQIVAGLVALGWSKSKAVFVATRLASRGARDDDLGALRSVEAIREEESP
jgi:hypothetical protein